MEKIGVAKELLRIAKVLVAGTPNSGMKPSPAATDQDRKWLVGNGFKRTGTSPERYERSWKYAKMAVDFPSASSRFFKAWVWTYVGIDKQSLFDTRPFVKINGLAIQGDTAQEATLATIRHAVDRLGKFQDHIKTQGARIEEEYRQAEEAFKSAKKKHDEEVAACRSDGAGVQSILNDLAAVK